MNKNLEELEKEYIPKSIKVDLQNIEKRLWNLERHVKKLEQRDTYYPFTEEELLKEKIGGTN